MDEIEVDMDGEWRAAIAPDWLTTYGVSTCIAIGVADVIAKKAWLIHSPVFGHNSENLEEMLRDCVATRSAGCGLRVWVLGGDSVVSRDEAKLAREAVIAAVEEVAPKAVVTVCWKSVGMVQLIFTEDGWQLNGKL